MAISSQYNVLSRSWVAERKSNWLAALSTMNYNSCWFPKSNSGVPLFTSLSEFQLLGGRGCKLTLWTFNRHSSNLPLLVNQFSTVSMEILFVFPGRCGKATCSRDNLTCNSDCNTYAMLVDAEFPPNTRREEHLLEALGRQIQLLYGYYFGLGSYLLGGYDAVPITLALSPPSAEGCPPSVASTSSTQPLYEDISPVTSPPMVNPTVEYNMNQEYTNLVSGLDLFPDPNTTAEYPHLQ